MINSHEAAHGPSTCHFEPGVRCVFNTPCDITKQPSKINNSGRKIAELVSAVQQLFWEGARRAKTKKYVSFYRKDLKYGTAEIYKLCNS
jgi:hypothetical protein